jgi:hypothetical protein
MFLCEASDLAPSSRYQTARRGMGFDLGLGIESQKESRRGRNSKSKTAPFERCKGCATRSWCGLLRFAYQNAHAQIRRMGHPEAWDRVEMAYRDFLMCLMETYYRVLSRGVLESVISKIASSVMSVGGSHRRGIDVMIYPSMSFLGIIGGSPTNVTQTGSSVFSAGVFTGLFDREFCSIQS